MLITQKYEVKLKEKMHKVHMSIKICQNPHNFQVLYKNLEIISSHSLCEALFVKLCDYLEVSFAPYHDQNHGQSLVCPFPRVHYWQLFWLEIGPKWPKNSPILAKILPMCQCCQQLLEKCQQLVGMASWDLIRAKRIIFWRFLAIFS